MAAVTGTDVMIDDLDLKGISKNIYVFRDFTKKDGNDFTGPLTN